MHWQALAMKNGGPRAWAATLGLVEQVDAALADVQARLPAGFPDRIWSPIADGMRKQAQKFLNEA